MDKMQSRKKMSAGPEEKKNANLESGLSSCTPIPSCKQTMKTNQSSGKLAQTLHFCLDFTGGNDF